MAAPPERGKIMAQPHDIRRAQVSYAIAQHGLRCLRQRAISSVIFRAGSDFIFR